MTYRLSCEQVEGMPGGHSSAWTANDALLHVMYVGLKTLSHMYHKVLLHQQLEEWQGKALYTMLNA
jgi:hypothetical protein